MRITVALRKRDSAVNMLTGNFSHSALFGATSDQMNTEYNRILGTLKGAPNWARSYLDGYRAALIASLYRNDLVYGGFIGETFYSTHRNRDDYYEKHGIAPSEYADNGRVTKRGHYWKETTFYKAGDKPFFIG